MTGGSRAVAADWERSHRQAAGDEPPSPADVRELRRVLSRLPSGARVADIGSGRGRHSVLAAEWGHRVVAVDISPTAAVAAGRALRARDGGEALVADADRLPLRAGSIDAVIAFGSLDYAPTRAHAMREVARVLRPGGRMVYLGWNATGLLYRATRSPRLKRWYVGLWGGSALEDQVHALGWREIRRQVEAQGLRVRAIRGNAFSKAIEPALVRRGRAGRILLALLRPMLLLVERGPGARLVSTNVIFEIERP